MSTHIHCHSCPQAANQGAKFKGRFLEIAWYTPKLPSVSSEPSEEDPKEETKAVRLQGHAPAVQELNYIMHIMCVCVRVHVKTPVLVVVCCVIGLLVTISTGTC